MLKEGDVKGVTWHFFKSPVTWSKGPSKALLNALQRAGFHVTIHLNMSYQVVQPPFTLIFVEMSRKELTDYYSWFMVMIPERVKELAQAVRLTPGFRTWRPDRTPESLAALGQWFAGQVETRPRTIDELRKIDEKLNSGFSNKIDTSGEEFNKQLTIKTFSLSVDIGMYLGQVFLKNHSSLRWTQYLSDKRFVDYGQPVLVEFRGGPLNPVRIMVVLARGLADKTRDGRRLLELYNIWAKKVVRPEE